MSDKSQGEAAIRVCGMLENWSSGSTNDARIAQAIKEGDTVLASLHPILSEAERVRNWPMRTVAELAADYGWGHADTGGGCTALEKEFFEGKYAYITDEASVPGDAKAACLLGFYDGTSSEPSFVFTCPDLETAMKMADMLTDL